MKKAHNNVSIFVLNVCDNVLRMVVFYLHMLSHITHTHIHTFGDNPIYIYSYHIYMYISWVKPKFWFEFCQLFVKQSSIYIYMCVCVRCEDIYK